MSASLDLAELRRLSAAATPGEWDAEGCCVGSDEGWIIWATRGDSEGETSENLANAAHVAAASPAVVLALLDRIEANERAIALGDARVRELEAQAAPQGDTLTKRQAAIIGAYTGARSAWRLAPFDLDEEQRQADREGCELRVALKPVLLRPVEVRSYRHALHRNEAHRIYAIRWQKREPSPPRPPELYQ